MKTKTKPDRRYCEPRKYSHGEEKRSGQHKKVQCKYCHKKTRSNNLKRHIGLMHGEKASKKQ